MLTRDSYIAILEKRAEEEKKPVDNVEDADKAKASIFSEDRSYLGHLFDGTGEVEKSQTQLMNRLFPGSSKKESGTPLIKTAHDIFTQAVFGHELLKHASPAYLEVAYRGFCNELEKIAAIKAQTMSQLGAKQDVGQRFGAQRVWNVSPAGLGGEAASRQALAPAVQAMRARPWWKKLVGVK